MNENYLGMREEVFEWWESFTDPYDRLAVIAKHLTQKNPEASFYDLFNFIREDLFKGWKYNDGSDFIMDIDFDIAYDERVI